MADDPNDPAASEPLGPAAADSPPASGGSADAEPASKPSATKPSGISAAAEAAGPAGAGTPVVRKKVTSKRVTPKGGTPAVTKGSTPAKAHAPGGQDAGYSARYTPPTAKYAQGPSPMWVPILMFSLLILGGLLIIANYARVFGDPDNKFLLAGLGCILGGIITATNYR